MKIIHTLVTNQVTRCSQRLVANQLSQVANQVSQVANQLSQVANQLSQVANQLSQVANQVSQVVLPLMTHQGTTCSQVARCHGKWLDVTASD